MWISYLKIAYRNLLKNKFLSMINILGLSIGMAACLLIIQYAWFELSYDDFHKNNPNIYRVRLDRIYSDRHDRSAGVTAGVGPALQEEYQEATAYTKLWGTKHLNNIFKYGEKTFSEDNVYFADSAFFNVFSYPLKKGYPFSALNEPYTVVLTESTAKRYFGEKDPVGKTITYSNPWGNDEFKVTGIAEDPPANTHLQFNILVSFQTLVTYTDGQAHNSWGWNAFPTYVLVEEGTDIKSLESKLDPFIQDHYKERIQEGIEVDLLFQPLQDIHLYSDIRFELGPNGSARSVYFLLIIAVFIVLIAWVNFINLSTSKSISRAKEVGIRKASGAGKGELIKQFLLESFLVNIISLAIAVSIIQVVHPFFDLLIGKEIPINLFTEPLMTAVVLGALIIGALLSGLYPAFVMSSFKPEKVLKGAPEGSKSGIRLRKVLVVFQFAITAFLIAGTLTVYKQVTFMRDQELGVDISQTLVINGPGNVGSNYESSLKSFKDEIKRHSQVYQMTNTTMVPGREIGWVNNSVRRKTVDTTNLYSLPFIGTGDDFIPTFDLKLLAGRNFDEERADESEHVILTRKAVEVLGFDSPDDALNKIIIDSNDPFKVIGVVENFHQQSLSSEYLPIIFRYVSFASSYYAFKINTNNISQTINYIKEEYNRFFPGNPFDYFFLDEFYNDQYRAEIQFGQTFGIFSLLAIFVACLGLAGLTVTLTSQRTKEIGIRKVLGASVPSILKLLVRDLLILVITGLIIGLPMSYYGSEIWLENYAFRIEQGLWLILIPATLIIIITFMTIIPQVMRAAFTNPVDSLRYE